MSEISQCPENASDRGFSLLNDPTRGTAKFHEVRLPALLVTSATLGCRPPVKGTNGGGLLPAARTSYCLSGRWRFFISLSGLKAAAKVTSLRQISGAMVRCSWLSSGLPQLWHWHCDQYTEYTMHFWHLSAQNLYQKSIVTQFCLLIGSFSFFFIMSRTVLMSKLNNIILVPRVPDILPAAVTTAACHRAPRPRGHWPLSPPCHRRSCSCAPLSAASPQI